MAGIVQNFIHNHFQTTVEYKPTEYTFLFELIYVFNYAKRSENYTHYILGYTHTELRLNLRLRWGEREREGEGENAGRRKHKQRMWHGAETLTV